MIRVALFSACLLVAGNAHAAEWACAKPAEDIKLAEDAARKLFDEALALEPADPSAALDRLRCARRHADRPAIALRIGTIAERLGRIDEAIGAFEHYLELTGESAPDRAQLRARLVELSKQRDQAAATSKELGPTSANQHDGTARAANIAGWTLVGVGAALGLVGAALLAVAKQQSDDVQAIEAGSVRWDSDEARGTYEQARRNQAGGIAALALGGAALVSGVVLVAVFRAERAETAVSLELGVGRALVRATY